MAQTTGANNVLHSTGNEMKKVLANKVQGKNIVTKYESRKNKKTLLKQ